MTVPFVSTRSVSIILQGGGGAKVTGGTAKPNEGMGVALGGAGSNRGAGGGDFGSVIMVG